MEEIKIIRNPNEEQLGVLGVRGWPIWAAIRFAARQLRSDS